MRSYDALHDIKLTVLTMFSMILDDPNLAGDFFRILQDWEGPPKVPTNINKPYTEIAKVILFYPNVSNCTELELPRL